MSLFSNDMRVANTAAPSFEHQANVGQFGWTGADQGHYNQLLQYVDECRKIWVNLEEKILFIENLLTEVTEIDGQVKYVEQMTAHVVKLAGETRTFRDQTANMYNDVKPLVDSFFPAYEDALKKYEDVIKMHSETEQAAIAAAQSEINAAKSAKDAADTAEELRKGQVYRGTWNIEANASYPAAPDTNSVWDVTLNESSISYVFDNQTWYWGDRLLYLKDENKFSQIESGSGVVSVNGKSGAVTLNAEDVGAPTVRVDKTIVVENRVPGGPIGVIKSQEGVSWLVQGDDVNPQHVAIGASATAGPVFYDGSETPKIFHEKFLPTANQVGAVSKAGDTITGPLFWTDNQKYINASGNNMYVASKLGRVYIEGTSTPIARVGGTDYNMYHQGFKPTAADVGAIAIGNSREDTLKDSGIYDGNPRDFNTLEVGFCGLIPLTGSTNAPPWESSGEGHVHVEVQRLLTAELLQRTLPFRESTTTAHRTLKHDGTWGPWYTAYTNGFKPTAADVKALPIGGGTLTGDLSISTSSAAPLTIKRSSQVGIKFESGANIRYIGVNNNGDLRFGSSSDHGSNYLVYHSGAKPTPADIDAVSINGTNHSPRYGVNFTTANDIWIAANFQKEGSEGSVVVGCLGNSPVIGGHTKLMNSWEDLYVNTFPGDNVAQVSRKKTVMSKPHELYTTGAGVVIQRSLPSRSVRTSTPNWFLSGSNLRFMTFNDLAMAASSGTSGGWGVDINLDAYRFFVRLKVTAASVAIYNHCYSFTIDGLSSTNSQDRWLYPHSFTAHAQYHRKGEIYHQLVPGTENGGAPYWELYLPDGVDLAAAQDKSITLEICAMNIWE